MKAPDTGFTDPFRGIYVSSLNKSSTEPKFEKYFEEMENTCNKNKNNFKRKRSSMASKNTSTFSINNKQDFSSQMVGPTCRKRKSSTISNLSNLDFHGSCLHLHAVSSVFLAFIKAAIFKNNINLSF